MPMLRRPNAPRQLVEWRPVVVGGGGFLLNVEISQDGATILTNGDVDGLYRFDDATETWDCLSTVNSGALIYTGSRYPGLTRNSLGHSGPAIAPSNSDIIYTFWRPQGLSNKNTLLLRSDDRGETFQICEGYINAPYADATGSQILGSNTTPWKTSWRKIGIDPSNPDVIYVPFPETGGKPKMSTDGGQTFTTISGLPTQIANTIGASLFAVDPSSAIAGGRHQRVICFMYGDGFYETTDGGTTWTEFYDYSTTGNFFDGGAFGPDGVFYVAIRAIGVLRYQSGTVTNIRSTGAGINVKVAVHPTIAGQIAILVPSTGFYFSSDHGTTQVFRNSSTECTVTCPTVGWQELQMQANPWTTCNQIAWNPAVTNELWSCFSQGIVRGVVDGSANPYLFEAIVLGIEELVGNQVLAIEGNSHINLFAWDEGAFLKTKTVGGLATPPADRTTSPNCEDWAGLFNFWMADFDPQNPDTVVVAANRRAGGTLPFTRGAYSTDGGLTWADFANVPTVVNSQLFQQIAINDGVTLWLEGLSSSRKFPMRTEDLGATAWTALDATNFTGHSNGTWSGFGSSLNAQYKSFVSDRVNPDVFYGHCLANNLTDLGIWRSTDRGQNFDEHFYYAGGAVGRQLHAVPDNEGHLFVIPGGGSAFPEGLTTTAGVVTFSGSIVYRSTDGGQTMTDWSTNIRSVDGFGFGKPQTVGGYPTIYFSGFYKGFYGIFRVVGNDLTTITQYYSTEFREWPMGLGMGNWTIQHITGDPDIFGRVYISFGNHGFCYADLP
jgi:hypothetical protein